MDSNITWEIHQGFLEKETCDLLEQHFEFQKENGRCHYGEINGVRQGKSFDLYGDSFCEAIGVYKAPIISKQMGIDLSLTYGIMREYQRGAVLKYHRDRWHQAARCRRFRRISKNFSSAIMYGSSVRSWIESIPEVRKSRRSSSCASACRWV